MLYWDEFDRAWARDAYGRLRGMSGGAVTFATCATHFGVAPRVRFHRLPDLDRQR